jgi:hypothetical protein
MLIKNYGLFWRLDQIFWGWQGVSGHLRGVASWNKTATPVDFRYQQGVYVLYDQTFRMIYVGQAGANDENRLFDRLKQHTRDQLADRWSRFSWFGVRSVNQTGLLRAENIAVHSDMTDVLNHIEGVLIASSEPPHNRQGGRFGDQVEQYLQERDERLGPEPHKMIYDIWHESQT